jgi:hypothetical protein
VLAAKWAAFSEHLRTSSSGASGRAAGSEPKRNGVGAVTGLSVFLTSLDAYRALSCMGVPDNVVCGLFRERAAQSGDIAQWL